MFSEFEDFESQNILEAIKSNLIISIDKPQKTKAYMYYNFKLDMSLVNRFENIDLGQYSILGTKIWDNLNNKFLPVEILVFNGLVMGISLPLGINGL